MQFGYFIGALILLGFAIREAKAMAPPAGALDWEDSDMPEHFAIPTDARRGERLNNPGNIRHGSSAWLGKSPDQPDSEFVKFISPAYGFRAMAIILRNYGRLYGLRTVRQIVSRWAPPSENPTESYIRTIAAALGVSDSAPIDLDNADTLARLVAALTRFEQGRMIYPAEIVAQGVALTGTV